MSLQRSLYSKSIGPLLGWRRARSSSMGPGMELAGPQRRRSPEPGSGIGRGARRAASRPRARERSCSPTSTSRRRRGGRRGGRRPAVRTDVGRRGRDQRADRPRARRSAGRSTCSSPTPGSRRPDGGPDVSDESWDRAWRVNVMAHIWAARALLPEMLERGDGYLLEHGLGGRDADPGRRAGLLGYQARGRRGRRMVWRSPTATPGSRSRACARSACAPRCSRARSRTAIGAARAAPGRAARARGVADSGLEAIRDERFLILPHPRSASTWPAGAADNERWLAGMRRMVRQRPRGRRRPAPKARLQLPTRSRLAMDCMAEVPPWRKKRPKSLWPPAAKPVAPSSTADQPDDARAGSPGPAASAARGSRAPDARIRSDRGPATSV